MKENNRLIKSIQTIRFILFILIFVHHTKTIVKIPILDQPGLAVSGFIILSGFLNGYIYKNKYDKISFKNVFEFIYGRLKKLYPLHIIMLILALGLKGVFNINDSSGLIEFVKKFLANGLLIHSWINNPEYYFSFNGVSWFLSTYLFLMIVTLPFLKIINILNKKKNSFIYFIVGCFVLFGLHILITYLCLSHELSAEYYIYVFPPSRIFEFLIGMILGNQISKVSINFKYDKIVFTILELLCILFVYVTITYIPNSNYLSYWGTKWVVPMLLLISIFTLEKGYISKLFSFKIFTELGSSTMTMFLIHQVLITYIGRANGTPKHFRYMALFDLIITIIIGVVITKLLSYKKFKSLSE